MSYGNRKTAIIAGQFGILVALAGGLPAQAEVYIGKVDRKSVV